MQKMWQSHISVKPTCLNSYYHLPVDIPCVDVPIKRRRQDHFLAGNEFDVLYHVGMAAQMTHPLAHVAQIPQCHSVIVGTRRKHARVKKPKTTPSSL